MLMFVYGTLKAGCGNHYHLKNATPLGVAVTREKMALAGYGVPFVWPLETGHQLQGEVYDIGDPDSSVAAKAMLIALDRLESNGHVYERRLQPVRLLDGGNEVMAWIYEAVPRYRRLYDDEDIEHQLNSLGAIEWKRPSGMTARRA